MPRAMDEEQFAAHAAHEDRHWWFTARRAILRDVVDKLLDRDRDALVMDVGCGTGSTVAELSRTYRVLGVEPSAAAVRRARAKYPGCEFVHGTAPAVVGPRIAEVRLVTLTDVLEHVRDDRRLLADVVHACRPGTWFVLTVPADMSLWSEHDVALGHYRRYDASGLASLWRDMPVSCELLAPLNRRLEPVVRLVRGLRRWWGGGRGAAGTDLSLPAPPLNRLLHRVFAAEADGILRSLAERRPVSAGRGVSLLAILRREPDRSPVGGQRGSGTPDSPVEILIDPRHRSDVRDRRR
jgi:SAM-dependent methyltransferase